MSSQAQDFTLPSASDSSLIRLADHAGKVVLVNWWRTSCRLSQQESPRLITLYEKYRDKGLVIIGVSDDDAQTVSEIAAYRQQYGVTWLVGLNDQAEFIREVRPLGQGSTPGNYLVSRSGALTYLGLDRTEESWQKLEAAVELAIAEPTPPAEAIVPRVLTTASAFSLPTLQGRQVMLSHFAGKPLVVNFFTADSCDWAGATVAKLHQDYAPHGLEVIGINLFDDDAAVEACVNRHAAKYPVLKGDHATQNAWIGSNAGWATFFVTRDGKIFKKIVDSIANGLEGTVFAKYAEYLASA